MILISIFKCAFNGNKSSADKKYRFNRFDFLPIVDQNDLDWTLLYIMQNGDIVLDDLIYNNIINVWI